MRGKCAKAQRLSVSRSPRRRPAVGSKRGLLMFQPYLCKSHFAVQSQWLIARSRCLSPALARSLSHSPVPLRTRSSTWHPSQEFPPTIICVGKYQVHHFRFPSQFFSWNAQKRRGKRKDRAKRTAASAELRGRSFRNGKA